MNRRTYPNAGKLFTWVKDVKPTVWGGWSFRKPKPVQGLNTAVIGSVLAACTVLLFGPALHAADLTGVGVLGNSGEQGETLVRFSDRRARDHRDGLGVVFDRFGTLWDRAGIGRLNRYTLDGRQLGHVEIPPLLSPFDQSCLVGDLLMIKLRETLWMLDTASTNPTPIRCEPVIDRMANNAIGGQVLVQLSGEEIKLAFFNPVEGHSYPVSPPPGIKQIHKVGISPSGDPLVIDKAATVFQLEGYDPDTLNAGAWREIGHFAENGPWMEDNAYWGGNWHGTLKRFDTAFSPNPGVVLGGGSGSFIGHLEGNGELENPTGFTRVAENLYALGGLGGVAHLAAWDDQTQRLTLVRRIGALHQINGHLAIHSTGRIRVPRGFWDWTDGPADPLRFSSSGRGNGQVAMFDNGAMFSSYFAHGSVPALSWGSFDKENKVGIDRLIKNITLPKDVTGCVVLRGAKDQRRVLRITSEGNVYETRHGADGRPYEELGKGTLLTQSPITKSTSMAACPDGSVLVAADGNLLTMERVAGAGDWRETKRTQRIGDIVLGPEVWIYGDGNRLWVSDTQHHRVMVADLSGHEVQGVFGGAQGDDLKHLNQPTAIAANGSGAVVFDRMNQRLLKLKFTDDGLLKTDN